MSAGDDLIATASETVGPFFHFGLAADDTLGEVAAPSAPGQHLTLRVRVTDGDGAPVPDALIEIWQVDADGRPAPIPPAPGQVAGPFRGYGRLPTSGAGTCEFATIRPGRAREGEGRGQAPHINVCLFARGLLRQVYTRVYFQGDPGLDADPVLVMVPPARRATLLASPDAEAPGRWLFELRLQGAYETVFFDL